MICLLWTFVVLGYLALDVDCSWCMSILNSMQVNIYAFKVIYKWRFYPLQMIFLCKSKESRYWKLCGGDIVVAVTEILMLSKKLPRFK